MNRTLIGAAVAAALTLTGMSARAGCADPRAASLESAGSLESEAQLTNPLALPDSAGETASAKESARERIVGSWHVTYTAGGAPFAQAFIQWHDDGTEWESINQPILGGTICLGSWKAVDHSQVARAHIGWLYTNGVLSGHFTETETDRVSADGTYYEGTNLTKIYDLTGHKLAEIPGTAKARRISPP
jgi:hypothetical protein